MRDDFIFYAPRLASAPINTLWFTFGRCCNEKLQKLNHLLPPKDPKLKNIRTHWIESKNMFLHWEEKQQHVYAKK